ncbi:GNAT family N-acetyltransferase [Sansalvadorimonas verongulae]|uniref:GNAT family N-acetyltransferase n=1 Tax=Sansalvadorimonas verongulae TaxID=2172824 RepID=UPI002E367685|nr:GNAT family protein [Sansalvadorimonas verongulae]MTI12606.1 N-acetyltransferase [Sansalvadorimonas verongulae]
MFKLTVDEDICLYLEHESFAPKYYELVNKNYDYLSQWLAWPAHCKTVDSYKDFVKGSLKRYAENKGMSCAIEYKGTIVGNIGFNAIHHNLKKTEIGYWLSESHQGFGIITRSCRFLIDYAFTTLGMERVQISAAKDNLPSRAVCERLGMRLEGIISNCEKVGDRVLDHAVYGIHKQ